MELPRQKGFYDSRRQFQGKDDPVPQPPEPVRLDHTPPRGQLITGLVLLALIALAFFKFAIPERQPAASAAPAPTQAAAAPAPAAK